MRKLFSRIYVFIVSYITIMSIAVVLFESIWLTKFPVVLDGQESDTKYITNGLCTLFHTDSLKIGDAVKIGESIPVFIYEGTVDKLNLDFIPFICVTPDYFDDVNIGRIVAKRGSTVDYKNNTVYVDGEPVLSDIKIGNLYGDFPYTLKRGEYLVLPDFSDVPEKVLISKRVHTESIEGKLKCTRTDCPTYGVLRSSDIVGKVHEIS